MTGKACAASCSSCIGSRRTDHIRPSPHPPTEGSSPSPHPARASHRWHTHTLLRQPPPRPRFALLPHPLRRNSAGSGFPGEERVRTRSSRLVPVHWTVVDIATGGGDRGGGSSPPRAKWYPHVPLRPPTPPTLRAPPPPPPGGEGSQGDTRWEAVPGSGSGAGFPGRPGRAGQNLVLPRDLPRAVDRGDIAMGGRGREVRDRKSPGTTPRGSGRVSPSRHRYSRTTSISGSPRGNGQE
ncbi:MAG: hypothetical protein BWY88_00820 [Synergistetes bacterium ADurb.Bin520]|nr:MAG: hypothetical protein BWY88_00820 [Synergistetes bacterium ADurb.Bin520]